MKGRTVFLFAHLRTLLTASLVALVVVACGGSDGGTSPVETPSDELGGGSATQTPNVDASETVSDVDLIGFELMTKNARLPHSAYGKFTGHPEPGEAVGRLQIVGDIKTVNMSVADEQGNILSTHTMITRTQPSVKSKIYYGDMLIPSDKFTVVFDGEDLRGNIFNLKSEIFTPQVVSVYIDAPAIVDDGETATAKIKIKNFGSNRSLYLRVSSDNPNAFTGTITKPIILVGEYEEVFEFRASELNERDFFTLKAEILLSSTSNEVINYSEHTVEVFP